MSAAKAGIKKLIMPSHSSYSRQSADQEAIEAYIAKHGVREAKNTGKVFSFNNVEMNKRGTRAWH